MMGVSGNHVLKLIFSFIDMSVFGYTGFQSKCLANQVRIVCNLYFDVCLLEMMDHVSEGCAEG